MPSSLSQLEARVAARLGDPASTLYTAATLDEALRSALAEYNAALPLTAETVITLPAAGREIALSGVSGLLSVSAVWWPYTSTGAQAWPPPEPPGFRVWWDDAQPVLILTARAGAQPQAGDELRLWYTRLHTIQDLDGGAATTLFGPHETGLVTGAAGTAALAQASAQIGTVRLDEREVAELTEWAAARLAEFRAWLAAVKASAPTHGEPWGEGWRMDKWEG